MKKEGFKKEMVESRNFISGLYPSTKLVFVFIMLVLSVMFSWKFSYYFVLPICILIALLDGKFIGYIKKLALALFVFVAFIFVFQIMLDPQTTPIVLDLGFIKITDGAILSGLNQTKILITLVSTILLFFETTDMEEFMYSLQQMRVSHVVTYVVLSTLQLIPDMSKKSTVIMEAQQARGIETEGSVVRRMKAFFPSLGPLIISSITDIEDRTVTLEVRGFSSEKEKTSLREIKNHAIDKLLIAIMIIFLIGMIVWRFA